jgi:hypothetical protein
MDPNQTCSIVLNPTLNATLNATLYQPPQEWYYAWLKEWSPILLGAIQVLTAIALAILTYRLCKSTSAYATQVETQTKIMDKKLHQDIDVLRYHRLQDEMDKLVAPLDSMVRTGFEYYEPVHLNEKYVIEDEAYWRVIRKNVYLASDNLHEAIEKYFKVCEKQKEALRKVRYEIQAIDSTPRKILFDPAPVEEGFGSYLREIKDLQDAKGSETDYAKKINWLHDIVQEGYMYPIRYKDEVLKISVKDARIDLKDAIETRYKTLLKQLKDVEKDLDIPIN